MFNARLQKQELLVLVSPTLRALNGLIIRRKQKTELLVFGAPTVNAPFGPEWRVNAESIMLNAIYCFSTWSKGYGRQ